MGDDTTNKPLDPTSVPAGTPTDMGATQTAPLGGVPADSGAPVAPTATVPAPEMPKTETPVVTETPMATSETAPDAGQNTGGTTPPPAPTV